MHDEPDSEAAEQETSSQQPLQARLQSIICQAASLKRALESRLPAVAARLLRTAAGTARSSQDMDQAWRSLDIPGIVVHPDNDAEGATCQGSEPVDQSKLKTATKRKSPITVQEWVDCSSPHPEASELPALELTPSDPIDIYPSNEVDNRRQQFSRARSTERMTSVASDASNASSTGVESILESRTLDPEQILINLGFGTSQDASGGNSGLSRIPKRFLQPSQCKGISLSDLYRHELNNARAYETRTFGYRGLTGPSHIPSQIVAKITERLEHRDEGRTSRPNTPVGSNVDNVFEQSLETLSRSPHRFANIAKGVRSALSRLSSWKSMNHDTVTTTSSGSILNQENRDFLLNQSLNKSPNVPRKKLIMGHRSYTFSGDGDLIECNQDKQSQKTQDEANDNMGNVAPYPKPRPPLVHKDSVLSSNASYSDESDYSEDDFRGRMYSSGRQVKPAEFQPSTEVLEESLEDAAKIALANRRGSLKRQSRVNSSDEEAWNAMSSGENSIVDSSIVSTGLDDIFEEPDKEETKVGGATSGLSRANSAQSDSSGFQDGAVLSSTPQTDTTETQVATLQQLEAQLAMVASGINAFKEEILARNDPETQAQLQVRADQLSGVLLCAQSLFEGLPKPNESTTK